MPVAVILLPDTAPAIIEETSDISLEKAIRSLPSVPDGIENIVEWIETLPAPSGWFATADEAQAYVDRTNRERDAKLMRAAISAIGARNGGKISQSAMARALGLADPQNDGSSVRKVLLAKHGLTGTARRALAYLIKYGPMSEAEQEQILNGLDNGSWRTVAQSDIRRLA